MEKIFELINQPGKEEGKKTEVRVGIRVKLSSFETTCFVTAPCQTYRALESEVQVIRQNLEDVLKEARRVFEGSSKTDKLGLKPDMSAGEIWTVLSAILDEGDFIQAFNALEEGKRKEVAEHILTHCNVFSGKAAVFSSHYDDQSALLMPS
jgi:hypothetical protein